MQHMGTWPCVARPEDPELAEALVEAAEADGELQAELQELPEERQLAMSCLMVLPLFSPGAAGARGGGPRRARCGGRPRGAPCALPLLEKRTKRAGRWLQHVDVCCIAVCVDHQAVVVDDDEDEAAFAGPCRTLASVAPLHVRTTKECKITSWMQSKASPSCFNSQPSAFDGLGIRHLRFRDLFRHLATQAIAVSRRRGAAAEL